MTCPAHSPPAWAEAADGGGPEVWAKTRELCVSGRSLLRLRCEWALLASPSSGKGAHGAKGLSGPSQAQGPGCPLGAPRSLRFQPQRPWSLTPKALSAACVPLVSVGRTCGAVTAVPEGAWVICPGVLGWGRVDSTCPVGTVMAPRGRESPPGLQAGAWLRGCLRARLPWPHSFHSNQPSGRG